MHRVPHSFDGPHDPDQAARDYFDALPARTADEFNDFVDANVRIVLDEEADLLRACLS